MPQIFYKDGTPVPDAKIAEAIASGQAFAKSQRVKVRNASGQVGTIDASDLGNPDYTPLTDTEIAHAERQEKYGGIGQQAIAGAEGAARGLTLGASDVALTGALGEEYRQGAEARQEIHPRTALASELAGAIAPSLIPGGAEVEGTSLAARGASAAAKAAKFAPSNLVARAGQAIEHGVARVVGEQADNYAARAAQRALALGTAGAAEGAAYGAGSAASDAALHDTPITAEKLLGSMGHGALFGGGLGAGMGALSGAGSRAVERIVGNKSLSEGAKALAAESALKSVGFQGSDFRGLIGRRKGAAAEKAIVDAGQELLDYTFTSGPLKGQKLFTGAKKAEDYIGDLATAHEELGLQIGAIRQQVTDAGGGPDLATILKRVDEEVLNPLRSSLSPTERAKATTIERELADLRARLEPQTEVLKRPPRNALPDGQGFDSAASAAENVAEQSGTKPELQRFLNENRRAVSEGERAGVESETSKEVTRFLHEAQKEGATYDGLVYRGTNERELKQILKTGRANHTLSVSQDIEGAQGFAKKPGNGVLLEIKDHPVPVDGIEGSNTFSEALIPKDSPARIVGERVENGQRIVTVQMGPDAEAAVSARKPREPLTYADIDKFQKELRSQFQPPAPPRGGLPAPVPTHARELEQTERIFADELDKSVERHMAATGQDPTQYEKLKRTFGAISDIEKVANKSAAQQLGNRVLSLTDYGTGMGTAIGAMLSGNIGGALLGGASAFAHKIIRERGRSVLAVMADSVAKMDGRIAHAADVLAGIATRAPRRVATAWSSEDFARTMAQVQDFASNPAVASKALARPTEAIAPQYPDLAAQMQQTLQGDHQYLATKLPQVLTRAGSSLTPQLEKPQIPKYQQQKFMAIAQALEDPASVIEKVAHGELPTEQLEALRVRRPEIWNQMRTQAIRAFSEAKKPLDVLERTRVSMAFDFNGDASLQPQNLQKLQSQNRDPGEPEDLPVHVGAPQGTGKRGRPQAAKPMNPKNATLFATPSQKAIGGY